MRRLLLALLPLLAACQRQTVSLDVVFELKTDGGAPLDCAAVDDLTCVNFIEFQIEAQGSDELATQCLKVDKRLATLCDVAKLAKGTEVFRHARGDTVQIKVWGLRVFPATSCELNPDCASRRLFSGQTDWMPLGAAPGGQLPLRITDFKLCGTKEVYEPRDSRDCDEVCQFSAPVCRLPEGCVCLVQDDGGTPASGAGSNGDWAPAPLPDAGVD